MRAGLALRCGALPSPRGAVALRLLLVGGMLYLSRGPPPRPCSCGPAAPLLRHSPDGDFPLFLLVHSSLAVSSWLGGAVPCLAQDLGVCLQGHAGNELTSPQPTGGRLPFGGQTPRTPMVSYKHLQPGLRASFGHGEVGRGLAQGWLGGLAS